jgi:hypothetical protein
VNALEFGRRRPDLRRERPLTLASDAVVDNLSRSERARLPDLIMAPDDTECAAGILRELDSEGPGAFKLPTAPAIGRDLAL